MITYANGTWKNILWFSMVFEDGDVLTGCDNENPNISDEDLIAACNRTNPQWWGKVVAIKDRQVKRTWVMQKDATCSKCSRSYTPTENDLGLCAYCIRDMAYERVLGPTWRERLKDPEVRKVLGKE